MPSEDWEKWLQIAEINSRRWDRIEKKVDEIHDVVYKNGLSSKVNTLWSINKVVTSAIITIVVGIIIGTIVFFVTNPFSNAETNKRLDRIEHKIEQHLTK